MPEVSTLSSTFLRVRGSKTMICCRRCHRAARGGMALTAKEGGQDGDDAGTRAHRVSKVVRPWIARQVDSP